MTDFRDDEAASINGLGAVPNPTYETAPDKVKRKVNETLDRAETVAAKALGADKAGQLRDKAAEVVDRGEDAYYGALDRLDAQVQRAPYQTMGIALGVGVVLGFLLAGNRRTVIYKS